MQTDLIQNDTKARQLALDASLSFIIEAPAGSGKTELLIQRLLTLLTIVKTPEEILAITFTKKAANEMRCRLIKALKNALVTDEPDLLHAKKTKELARKVLARDTELNWQLLNNPNQLRIQTIDSLCAYLTSQLPLLSHFGSPPKISDNPTWLYADAVKEVLKHLEKNLEWSGALAKLLLHLDNDLNKVHDLLVTLLAKRDQWLPYIHFDLTDVDIKKQLETHLVAVIEDHLLNLKTLIPTDLIDDMLSVARFAASQLAIADTDDTNQNILACLNLSKLPDIKNKTAWCGLAQLFLTKSFSWRKRVDADIGFPTLASLKNPVEKSLHQTYRQLHSMLCMKLQTHDDIRVSLTELFFLPDPHFTHEQWEILQALLEVLKIVAAQLRVAFQQQGCIDFIENAQAALYALGNKEDPTDLALALDYQIRHILIDEFQDTSLSQYQLLEKLTLGWEPNDGRTLFVVGDPMQSIYRFREAEVGLFLRMVKQGIGHLHLIPLSLCVNFRSTDKLINWTNEHFKIILPEFNDIALGAVKYNMSSPPKRDNEQDSNIQICGFVSTDKNIQAKAIVELIQEKICNTPDEKIALLVRSRSHLISIMPALKKANIHYQAIDIDPLGSRQVIQDLLALTCALLHPADRIAWLAVLRAPWCGLTLTDLLVITRDAPLATIWELLQDEERINQLSADGKYRLHRVLPIIRMKLAERGRYDLRYWIENTWQLLGGPATLPELSDLEDVNEFFTLLSMLEENDSVLSIDLLKEKISGLYASVHNDAPVTIMTIHTAKGLEFDTVILPHIERKNPVDQKALMRWLERPLINDRVALLLAPIHATGDKKNKIYDYIERQQKIKSEYEIDRLFYVAATRAKKHLHIFFNTEQKDQGNCKIEAGSFLQRLWPKIEKQQHAILNTPEIFQQQDNYVPTTKPISRLTAEWQQPIMFSKAKSVTMHQTNAGFQLRDNYFAAIGIVIHQILQSMTEYGVSWWQAQAAQQQLSYLKQQLIQQRLLPEKINEAVNCIQIAIANTLNDSRGLWILKNHQDARSEFAISMNTETGVENLVIDRTFIDETGTRWIIDYKATTFSSLELENFLAKEQKKYLEKMTKYAKTMQIIDEKQNKSNGCKLGLYFPAIPAWHEWDFVE